MFSGIRQTPFCGGVESRFSNKFEMEVRLDKMSLNDVTLPMFCSSSFGGLNVDGATLVVNTKSDASSDIEEKKSEESPPESKSVLSPSSTVFLDITLMAGP